MKPYGREIRKTAGETKSADQTPVSKVIGDELGAANVKVKDDAFKSASAGYMQTEPPSTSSEKKELESSDSKASNTRTSDFKKATNSSSKVIESSSR